MGDPSYGRNYQRGFHRNLPMFSAWSYSRPCCGAAAEGLMIRTAEAFEAIAQTLALGSMAYEHQRAANGCYLACLDARGPR